MKDGKPAAKLFKIRLHEKEEEEEYMLPYKKNFNSWVVIVKNIEG